MAVSIQVPIDPPSDYPVRSVRNHAFDWLRILAAYGIVAFHSGAPFPEITYAGLTLFLILSPFLECGLNWDRYRPVISTARTFLLPWLFWFIAYGALNAVRGGPILQARGVIGGLLFGTSHHLWFMPLMFVVIAGLNIAKKHALGRVLFWVASLCCAFLLVSVASWRPSALNWSAPLPQWMHAAPMILLGIALGLRRRAVKASVTAMRTILTGGLIVAVASGLPGVGIPYLLGAAAMSVAIWMGPRMKKLSWNAQPIASCMLGVYLTHPLWLIITDRLAGTGNYLSVTVAFMLAAVSTWIAQRVMPITQLVIGRAAHFRRRVHAEPFRPAEAL